MANEKDYAPSVGDAEENSTQMLEVKLEKDLEEALPSPVSAPTQRSKPKLSAAAIIPVWIVLSSSVIIYNNYLYNTLDFKFPVFLVTWHLTFAVSRQVRYVVPAHSDSLFATGYRHPCTGPHNTPSRRRERCAHLQGHVPSFHPPHWPALQRITYPEQHRLSVSLGCIYSDAQGTLSCVRHITTIIDPYIIGIYTSRHSPDFMDLQTARAEQEACCDRLHDIIWRRTRL